jgi:hypothetical protein
MRATRAISASALLAIALSACGGDDELCDPAAQTGCDDGLVCEPVQDGDPACFEPVVIRGHVFDLVDDRAIEAARVVALDVNGAGVTSVAETDADGAYTLTVPSERDAEGAPLGADITLRADAAAYQSFPAGIRVALPIDTGAAVLEDGGGYALDTVQTEIGLLALPDGAGSGILRGRVEMPADGGGVLVVAQAGSGPGTGRDAIADRSGAFVIFNLDAASYEVKGYALGVNHEVVSVDVGDGEDVSLEGPIAITDEAASTLTGQISIVNGGDGDGTSVILVVESTFDEVTLRGASPPGMRAPAPGVAPDITGAFTIEGVPAGTYLALAAFENDRLVRDPDLCIGGTEIISTDVVAAEDLTLEASFKVTGALNIFGPGADEPEAVDGVPVFSWEDDSSEDQYELTVFDNFGEIIWEHTEPNHTGDDPAVTYEGPALVPGMYYQFRVVSTRGDIGDACAISTTEDLAGVFYLP